VERAKYNAKIIKKNSEVKYPFSWPLLFHTLCSNYGWTIEYVSTLNMKQIRKILQGSSRYVEMVEKIQSKNRDKTRNYSNRNYSPDLPSINDVEDMRNSGFFKVNKKKKRN